MPTSGWWGLAAVCLYALFASVTAARAGVLGHPEAWLALLAVPGAILLRSRPWAFAAALVLGGSWLRVVHVAFEPIADQIDVIQAAASVAVDGGNPYGRGYAESFPPGAPFPYGPLALLWAPAGVWGEVAAGVASMVLIAGARCWLTLASYAAFPAVVAFSTWGINDVTPGLLITAGMLALARHPRLAALLVALAACLKPYALAWLPGIVGVGGGAALAVIVVTSLVVWLPALWLWGAPAILRSLEMAREIHAVPQNALNVPEWRVLALPVALAGFFARSWWLAAVSGLAVYLIWLFLDRWASVGYLVAIAPLAGILAERGARWALARRRLGRPVATVGVASGHVAEVGPE